MDEQAEQVAPGQVQARGPWFTISEVAEVTGISRSKARRMLDAGEFPNARQDDDGRQAWRIPATDLGAAGLGQTAPDREQVSDTGAAHSSAEVTALRQQVDDLTDQVADLRAQLARAEALAEARREHLATYEAWRRALGPGPTPQTAADGAESAATPSQPQAPAPPAANAPGGILRGLRRAVLGE